MNNLMRMKDEPIPVVRSTRPVDIVRYSSVPAGRVVPVFAAPLLREDAMAGRIKINLRMEETRELLMNGVELRAMAYVVPWLAMARFENSREQFDRSMAGLPKIAGGATVPFFELQAAGAHGTNLIHKYIGVHADPADQINTMYIESYNIIDEFRAKNRSADLPIRTRLQTDLAPAYWDHSRFAALVPDFDQRAMHAEVPLTIVNSRVPIRGIGLVSAGATPTTNLPTRNSAGEVETYAKGWKVEGNGSALGVDEAILGVKQNEALSASLGTAVPDIYAEMQANGITVTLANLDKAKQMKAFAKVREGFDKIEDDHIIDMMMNGLSVPDQYLKNPILIGEQKVTIDQIQRFATDAANMTTSTVSGGCEINMSLRCPQISVGGVIMIVLEVLPKQLFERQKDPFLHITNARYANLELKDLPAYVRDVLDEEKVDIVFNKDIDVSHASPTSHFGYAPQNWKWAAWPPGVGGDLFRPVVNTVTDTLRQEIWAVETPNPVLAEDFHRSKVIHLKPFVDQTRDPFRALVTGQLMVNGLTQFGPALVEASTNWDEVKTMSQTTQIVRQ